MPHANNRSAAKPRATFQVAGGTIIKYRHPFLAGQIHNASPVDEVDVSRALRLNDTFLDAQPAQDSSFQEVLVDGSSIVITNHLMNGTMTLQVLRTTGLVGTGDLIAAAHIVIASKDDVGGTLTVIENIDGKRIVTIFWGVSWKNVQHLKKAGNAVVPYPVTMNYAGWVQGVSSADITAKSIWAVGNEFGLRGVYKPYDIQEAEEWTKEKEFFSGKPLSADLTGVGEGRGDEAEGDDKRGIAKMPDDSNTGLDILTAEEFTWP